MKFLIALFVSTFLLLATVKNAYAVENPTAVANNKIGIHILFPSELEKAASLINSNNGDWGYVIIPIQSGDKDLEKWQNFMDSAKKLHVIPIIRLATEGDYFNTKVWRKPNPADVLDFANFLNSLSWPVKNRYIVVFNEVNRGDEWGGTPNPSEYANLLSYAVTTFKSKSNDFFIISAGMDNAAATTAVAINEYNFFTAMNTAVPGIFNQIDGMASHSYPNPAFSQPPSVISKTSITSFQFEKNLIATFSSKNLPIFITETGWDQTVVGQGKAADYLATALQTVWNTNDVVAITPFLLQAGGGPFLQFSLHNESGAQNAVYKAIANITKIHGAPVVNPESVLAAQTVAKLPTQRFSMPSANQFASEFEIGFRKFFKLLLHVQ